MIHDGVDRKMERLATDPRLRAMAERMFTMGPSDAQDQPRRRSIGRVRWMSAGALAASVIVAAVSAWALVSHVPTPVIYVAGAGGQRTLELEDGSTVRLDVQSEVAVRFTAKTRSVELTKGRALFDVAHDAGRPFNVRIENDTVTALGTRFQVQKQGPQVLVTLARGVVEVTSHDRGKRIVQRLRPGEQLALEPGGATKQRIDPEMVTSWSRGRHVFRDTPLREALAEVNRYSIRKVRLGDPGLAALTVSGNFIAGDSEQIVKAFAAVLPLRIVGDGDGELVLFGAQTSNLPPKERGTT